MADSNHWTGLKSIPADPPVVFLAFANAEGDLPELRAEIRQLQELFEAFQAEGRCRLEFRPNATLEQIFEVLTKQRDRIALFHFGGHADSGRLMVESALGCAPAHGQGLATLLGQQHGLQLAFLNGCSTRPQVQRLLEAGVPAVIATARPINDHTARELAVAFYTALTKGGDAIQGGQSLLGAFEAAKGFVVAREGGQARGLVTRDLGGEDVTDAHGFPWGLVIRPGAESVGRWNLFTNDPLFGLPKLPADIVPPPEPFRHLERFTREHARVFFGRGRAIRDLYDLVRNPGTAPVILYYGPTGVGKSSVLDAGLFPRLEEGYQVRYLRRGLNLGLLGTLRQNLAPEAEAAQLDEAQGRAMRSDRAAACVSSSPSWPSCSSLASCWPSWPGKAPSQPSKAPSKPGVRPLPCSTGKASGGTHSASHSRRCTTTPRRWTACSTCPMSSASTRYGLASVSARRRVSRRSGRTACRARGMACNVTPNVPRMVRCWLYSQTPRAGSERAALGGSSRSPRSACPS